MKSIPSHTPLSTVLSQFKEAEEAWAHEKVGRALVAARMTRFPPPPACHAPCFGGRAMKM